MNASWQSRVNRPALRVDFHGISSYMTVPHPRVPREPSRGVPTTTNNRRVEEINITFHNFNKANGAVYKLVSKLNNSILIVLCINGTQ